ncbi:MAG: SH3 domain-containing protein [Polyangiaceae bacterium]|nr:SH3 domain-containing protein [Polyangiaceae bacterium]MCW5789309.1 SH3 domain-containing protein [Polyangiaceae bacterium]
MGKTSKLRVEVPDPQADQPRLARVGIFAAVGFGVGLLLPAVLGRQFVPEPPLAEVAVAAEPEDAEEELAPAPPSEATSETTSNAEEPAPAARRVEPGKPLVLSCKDAAGKKVDRCDDPDLTDLVEARFTSLGSCAGTEAASGTLSLGLEVDFQSKKVERVLRGKSTTIAEAMATKLYACAEREFAGAATPEVEAQHRGYTVFYKAQFFPSGTPAPTAAPANEASGVAVVAWDSAVIRDQPNKDGRRLASILRGTRVTVTGKSDNWYRIKYDASGSEGWVYKDAIGM